MRYREAAGDRLGALERMRAYVRRCAVPAAVSLLFVSSQLPAFSSAAGLRPAFEPTEGVKFISPWAGAVIAKGSVILTGYLPEGVENARFYLNGSELQGVFRSGQAFSGSLSAKRGYNEISVKYGDQDARLLFMYDKPGKGGRTYRYHEPLLEGKCEACHNKTRAQRAAHEADMCAECHTASVTLYPHVHGPIATGKCLHCHDPHGSNLPGLTRMPTQQMCTSCHDQPGTVDHIQGNPSFVCTLCHDPHYSMRKYLLRNIE